ncbi:helicase [Candidatus Uhrbacteria bacterium]|nr:helicase [Candidatus Uhrbacteria bacterium]
MVIYPNCNYTARTIKSGGLSKDALHDELRKNDILLNEYAERIFNSGKFVVLEDCHEFRTVELTVGGLGFSNGATTREIIGKAKSLGLVECPLELAAYLRLQYLDQPTGHMITIASKMTEETKVGFGLGLYIRRLEDGLWLRGYRAHVEFVWCPESHLVFVDAN